jgi:oligopeptide/dipeptide ABC transporter ATP-binding protein
MSMPDQQRATAVAEVETALVRAEHVTRRFAMRRSLGAILRRQSAPALLAVDDVSLEVPRRSTYGLVGESGSGKTTLGRMLLRLLDVTAGSIDFDGVDVTHLRGSGLLDLRKRAQIVFQDPYSSLNPRLTVRGAVAEAIAFHARRLDQATGLDHSAVRRRADELLEVVGLGRGVGSRYPHELSGGQRQRVGIARALAVQPEFVVCDEPVSALDVSIRAQILNLLADLQEQFALTYLFIAHDLAVVRYLADAVGVMYMGRLVEEGPARRIFAAPAHPYTRALLSAVPEIDPAMRGERLVLEGEPGAVTERANACNFASRCPFVMDVCRQQRPPVQGVAGGGWAACWLNVPEHTPTPRAQEAST